MSINIDQINIDQINIARITVGEDEGATAVGGEAQLSTAEVARRLGVKPATVYAYVSRGLLTSRRSPDHRGSTFSADEVEQLAQRGRAGRSPVGAVERIRTAISTLDGDDLYYRGHRAVSLSTTASFEAVADLLWSDEPAPAAPCGPPAPPWPAPPDRLVEEVGSALAALPPGASLSERARVAVVVLGSLDAHRFDTAPGAVVRAARTVLAVLARVVGTTGRPTGAEEHRAGLAQHLWTGTSDRGASGSELTAVNAALVLLADHGLTLSTLAARLAASARADVYAVIGAGQAVAAGQVHAGAGVLAYDLIRRALRDPTAAVQLHLRAGTPVPGFGHRLYEHQDPRAELLLGLLPKGPVARAVDALCEHMASREHGFPNVDLALAAFVQAHGLRDDAGPLLFELARTAGWVAHALEELEEPGLRFRTAGVYTGEPPRRPRPARV